MAEGTIHAPWSDEVVEGLNRYQRGGYFHPYTCGTKELHNEGDAEDLVATNDGWLCPTCGYRQTWAHSFSVIAGDE